MCSTSIRRCGDGRSDRCTSRPRACRTRGTIFTRLISTTPWQPTSTSRPTAGSCCAGGGRGGARPRRRSCAGPCSRDLITFGPFCRGDSPMYGRIRRGPGSGDVPGLRAVQRCSAARATITIWSERCASGWEPRTCRARRISSSSSWLIRPRSWPTTPASPCSTVRIPASARSSNGIRSRAGPRLRRRFRRSRPRS